MQINGQELQLHLFKIKSTIQSVQGDFFLKLSWYEQH